MTASPDYPGFCRIPLAPRSKVPLVPDWSTLPADSPEWAKVFADHPDANVGIRLDGMLVVDCDTADWVTRWLETGSPSPVQSQGREDRRSFWYRLPLGDGPVPTFRLPGLDVKAGPGHQMVVPPSIHPDTGKPYHWVGAHSLVTVEQLPLAPLFHLMELARSTDTPVSHGEGAGGGWDVIGRGGRDNYLTAMAGAMRRQGASEGAILAGLLVLNQAQCHPPHTRAGVERIAHSVSRYDAPIRYEVEVVE